MEFNSFFCINFDILLRRIDSLGRIVIPKEIRKVLKIKENEQVEINVAGDEIVLNRYSEFNNMAEVLIKFLESIKEVFNIDIFLTDLNNFKIVPSKYKDLIGKEISPYLNHILERREEVKELSKTNLSLCDLVENIESAYIIKTILKNGDSVGLLIVLLPIEFNNQFLVIVDLINNYLDKYLE